MSSIPLIARLCEGSTKAYALPELPDGAVSVLWHGDPCETPDEARGVAIRQLAGARVCGTCGCGYVGRDGHEVRGGWACCVECRVDAEGTSQS